MRTFAVCLSRSLGREAARSLVTSLVLMLVATLALVWALAIWSALDTALVVVDVVHASAADVASRSLDGLGGDLARAEVVHFELGSVE